MNSSKKSTTTSEITNSWQPQPEAGLAVQELLQAFLGRIDDLGKLESQMLRHTGTRLGDWVDHFDLSSSFAGSGDWINRLLQVGYCRVETASSEVYEHSEGLFPIIQISEEPKCRLGIHVESVVDFLFAHKIQTPVIGRPLAAKRIAKVFECGEFEVWVIERHGVQCWNDPSPNPSGVEFERKMMEMREVFCLRNRLFDCASDGFGHALELIHKSIEVMGAGRSCDLFFEAERLYWQSRNRAARIQKSRQDQLGLGWGNHDHHTYRSSRDCFAQLVSVLETLGFICRERFYAGPDAGWGAQVLEQPDCGIVVFADVDLSEEELVGDFAHEGLANGDSLGTVGLWCRLHGESFLDAGMHHLECQFNYQAARKALNADGIQCMDAFTNFDYLKQCFTEPEIWPVDPLRVERLKTEQMISENEAAGFLENGAVGSHLEVLERNDGYKGFNQSGVSKIISKTDPRKQLPVKPSI